jgi:hypothetical protein
MNAYHLIERVQETAEAYYPHDSGTYKLNFMIGQYQSIIRTLCQTIEIYEEQLDNYKLLDKLGNEE